MAALRASFPWLALLILAVLAGLYSFPAWGPMWARRAPLGYDFYWVHTATGNLARGIDIFAPGYRQSLIGPDLLFPNPTLAHNPPPYYLLNLPLTWLGFFDAFPLYMVATPILYVLAAWLVARQVAPVPVALATTGLLALLTPYTAMGQDCLMLGQSSFLVAAMLGLAFVLQRKGHPGAAGFCLSVAIFSKLWPALACVWYLRRDRLPALAATLAWCAGLTLITGLLFGFDLFPHWAAGVKTEGIQYGPINQSFLGVGQRWLGPQSVSVLLVVNLLAAAGLALGTRLAAARLEGSRPGGAAWELAEYSAIVMLSTLFAAWSMSHHHLLIYLPFLAFMGLGLEGERQAGWLGAALVAAMWLLDGEVIQRPWLYLLHEGYRQTDAGFLQMAFIVVLLWVAMAGRPGAATRGAPSRLLARPRSRPALPSP